MMPKTRHLISMTHHLTETMGRGKEDKWRGLGRPPVTQRRFNVVGAQCSTIPSPSSPLSKELYSWQSSYYS
jgi:hypothetical protein